MATAYITPPIPVEPDIVLTLSMREARLLWHLCQTVGGLTAGDRGVFSGASGSIRLALDPLVGCKEPTEHVFSGRVFTIN